MQKQPEAAWLGAAQLSRSAWHVSEFGDLVVLASGGDGALGRHAAEYDMDRTDLAADRQCALVRHDQLRRTDLGSDRSQRRAHHGQKAERTLLPVRPAVPECALEPGLDELFRRG